MKHDSLKKSGTPKGHFKITTYAKESRKIFSQILKQQNGLSSYYKYMWIKCDAYFKLFVQDLLSIFVNIFSIRYCNADLISFGKQYGPWVSCFIMPQEGKITMSFKSSFYFNSKAFNRKIKLTKTPC